MRKSMLMTVAVLSLGAFSAAPVFAAEINSNSTSQPAEGLPGTQVHPAANMLVRDAAKTVSNLKQNQDYAKLLHQAKGVLIVPNAFGGTMGIGGQSGRAVMVRRTNSGWSEPAFLNLSNLALGSGSRANGDTVLLLMSRKAVTDFTHNGFTLNSGAGLKVAGFQGNKQAPQGHYDVIVWSSEAGHFSGSQVDIPHVSANRQEIQNFYHKKVSPKQILAGNAPKENAAQPLISELPT